MFRKTVFRWLGWLWSVAGGWPGRLAAWGCLAVAFAYLSLVALMIYKGGTWAFVVYAEDPYAHLAGGLFFLAAWRVVARGWREDAAWWRRFIGRAVLVVLSLVFSFAAAELALRMALIGQQRANSMDRLKTLRAQGRKLPVRSSHPMAHIIQPSDNSRLVFELQPGLDLQFGHKLLRTNGAGMRDDRDYATNKAPGAVRIVGIGDSGMFGWNVEQGEEYMAVLRSNLNRRADGARYEVLNLGVPGYNTQLEVEALRSKGLAYQPDIVVVGWCDNDFQLPFFMLEKENFRRRDLSYLHLLLFKRDYFADLVTGAHFRDLRKYDQHLVAEELLAGANVDGVERAMRDLKAMGEQHGFRVLVMGSMRREAREICDRVGLPYYDLNQRIARDAYPEEWAVHFMHPRPEGHRVLAERLEAEMVKRGWLPAAPSS